MPDTTAVDVADPDLYASGDPVAIWAELRATSPVYWNAHPPGPGFWAVMSYAPALQVYRDTDAFTSELGMRVDSDPGAVRAAAGKMLIVTDPPVHPRLRQLMNSAFVPRVVSTLEASMRRVIEPLIDVALTKDSIDFVSEIAAVLPAAIICDIMNIPQSERAMMTDLTSKAFGASVGQPGTSKCPLAGAEMTKTEAHAEIFLYYTELVAQRRHAPGDDVVSALIQGELDGRALTDEEVLLNCDGLLTGANETTRHASSAGLKALIENPAEWQRLKQGTVDIETAVDEVLRYTSPALHVMRIAKKDVQVGDQQVKAGDAVTIWNSSVNRDETVFPHPDRFLLSRTGSRHVTFGIGPHFCLGAPLARVELKVLLQVLAEKVTEMDIVGTVERLRSNFMWGIERLPVALS
ncbi:cytochrome P450 [Streptomyces jumonjinensis]|uniref:Cytochrome P450 n=1 Tax=Streptomyces jumonjinensis TaxID=1945 RepID=A0A646KEV0_STRJU|nr:cytochrome P450 [Streptomyces jumonjinensis]MQT00763.1 cytochrome P450 [Streptomyces jumonjinensis]